MTSSPCGADRRCPHPAPGHASSPPGRCRPASRATALGRGRTPQRTTGADDERRDGDAACGAARIEAVMTKVSRDSGWGAGRGTRRARPASRRRLPRESLTVCIPGAGLARCRCLRAADPGVACRCTIRSLPLPPVTTRCCRRRPWKKLVGPGAADDRCRCPALRHTELVRHRHRRSSCRRRRRSSRLPLPPSTNVVAGPGARSCRCRPCRRSGSRRRGRRSRRRPPAVPRTVGRAPAATGDRRDLADCIRAGRRRAAASRGSARSRQLAVDRPRPRQQVDRRSWRWPLSTVEPLSESRAGGSAACQPPGTWATRRPRAQVHVVVFHPRPDSVTAIGVVIERELGSSRSRRPRRAGSLEEPCRVEVHLVVLDGLGR